MLESLDAALADLRPLLLDPDQLVRAVAAGRRRRETPTWQRVELRPVDLKNGRQLQLVARGGEAPLTRNAPYGDPAAREVDDLLAEPFGNWHVQTTTETIQLRVTKKGEAQVHRSQSAAEQRTTHDIPSDHLIDPGDPLFGVLGAGADKRRQVDAFLRVLAGAVADAQLPVDRPLRVVDLGCGNAYLTFAAYRFLAAPAPAASGREVELVGVDVRAQSRERNSRLAEELGWAGAVRFVEGAILDAPVEAADVVLALHACDTATDDALAQAVRWQAPVVLAAPCCHHDLQRQLKAHRAPTPYALLTRHAILREHLGDVMTDSLRAALMRREGYRVEVLQFVASKHTPRNTMIKAIRAEESRFEQRDGDEYEALVDSWGVTPYLQTLLEPSA